MGPYTLHIVLSIEMNKYIKYNKVTEKSYGGMKWRNFWYKKATL